MATYPSLKYGTPPFVDPRWEDEEDPLALPRQAKYGPGAGSMPPPVDMRAPVPEDNDPFSYDRLAARKPQPFQMNPPASTKPPIGGWSSGPPQLGAALENAGPLPEVPQGPIQTPTGKPPTVDEDWINPGDDPFLTDWNTAAAKRDAHKAAKPKLGDKQFERPLWQKMLMIGANAAAGGVNAGRRTHIDPIDDKLLAARPKYNEAMDAWETQGKALDSEMGSLQQMYQLKRQGEADQRANKLSKRQNMIADAQIEELNARAEQRRRPVVTKPGQRFMSDRWGTIDTTTGEYKEPPSWAKKPETPPKEFNQTLEDAALEGLTGADRAAEARRLLAEKRARQGGVGGMTAAGAAADADRDRASLIAVDHANRQEVTKLDEEENYRMAPGADKGIHERLGELGPLLTPPETSDPNNPWKRADANVAEFVRLSNRLKTIYGRKLELNALKGGRAEYDAMIQGINENLKRLTQKGGKVGAAQEAAGPAALPSQVQNSRGGGPTIPQQGASRVTPGKTQRPALGSIITP